VLNNDSLPSTAVAPYSFCSNKISFSNILVYVTLVLLLFIAIKLTQEDKAIPLQALTCPEGSRRLRLPDFTTTGT
jgi:hypothetical protein